MATCKDCVHYDVCEFHLDEKTTMIVDECMHFKDASKLVKLPCKVDDTVYQIEEGFEIYPSVISRIIYETKGIAFDERAIGKSIFLTREEAEKALKERENNA